MRDEILRWIWLVLWCARKGSERKKTRDSVVFCLLFACFVGILSIMLPPLVPLTSIWLTSFLCKPSGSHPLSYDRLFDLTWLSGAGHVKECSRVVGGGLLPSLLSGLLSFDEFESGGEERATSNCCSRRQPATVSPNFAEATKCGCGGEGRATTTVCLYLATTKYRLADECFGLDATLARDVRLRRLSPIDTSTTCCLFFEIAMVQLVGGNERTRLLRWFLSVVRITFSQRHI